MVTEEVPVKILKFKDGREMRIYKDGRKVRIDPGGSTVAEFDAKGQYAPSATWTKMSSPTKKKQGQTFQGSKLAAFQEAKKAVNAFDDVLPADMLQLMRGALAADASFWAENNYNSPRVGFFSFQHPLPAFPPKAGDVKNGLDAMLQHIWQVAATAVPKVKRAKYVEWWAHTRQHCYGHQIHFDSVPGDKEGKPRHPIISTITFLTADCGGPTLITDQQIHNQRSTKGWLATPKTNRLVTFDGSLLHCVLPGAGAAPSAGARRTTFMAAFWEENPHKPEFASTLRAAKANAQFPGAGLSWPSNFDFQDKLKTGPSTADMPIRNAGAITPLGGGEIWEDIRDPTIKQLMGVKECKYYGCAWDTAMVLI
jgi:hypothetical protein